jgi:L-lactate dehydrogenase complex protein LldF
MTVVETDLGEYILQINHYEPPSHIIGPALHKSKEEVAELFHETTARRSRRHRGAVPRGAWCFAPALSHRRHGNLGRQLLRRRDGSVVLVTNEGNATLATTLPKVHVAISGIEKIVPTLEDVATLMRLLPRSATGQSISNYVDVLTARKAKGSFTAPSTCTSSSSTAGAPTCSRATFATRCAASAAAPA